LGFDYSGANPGQDWVCVAFVSMGDRHRRLLRFNTLIPATEAPFMAWLELDSSGNYHLSFRLGRRRFKRSLRTDNRRNAENLAARLEENLALVERGRLEIPTGADVPRFLLSDGKVAHKIEPKRDLTLRGLMEAFFAGMPAGSVEEITVEGMHTHERHLYRLLGEKFLIQNLTSVNLQGYIERRSVERGLRGRKVTGTTIKKAIVTLRTAWNWAVKAATR
jgi:hypothetical protein